MEERRRGPVVGLGTWNTFDRDTGMAREVVTGALEAGCRVLDSSPMYGGAEDSLSVALEGRRDEAVVWARADPQPRLVARPCRWLAREHEAGRIGRLGVTHYSPSAFDELADALRTGRFTTVQIPLNPLERECERELLPLAAELGVAVIVMRPLGAGGLVRRHPTSDVLAELGVATWAQALLKWALSDERVDLVLPASRYPDRVRSNAEAGTPPWFDAEQRALVERFAQ
jgi:diketogulonate reductase-like aldo/keto reductase